MFGLSVMCMLMFGLYVMCMLMLVNVEESLVCCWLMDSVVERDL